MLKPKKKTLKKEQRSESNLRKPSMRHRSKGIHRTKEMWMQICRDHLQYLHLLRERVAQDRPHQMDYERILSHQQQPHQNRKPGC